MCHPSDEQEDTSSTCKIATRSMTLQMVSDNSITFRCSEQACMAGALSVLAGSTIISDNIVLTANTVHWLEHQGTCSDSYLNVARQRFLESLNKPTPALAT
jgi:hypothetical protein